jgi:hypothetical protein
MSSPYQVMLSEQSQGSEMHFEDQRVLSRGEGQRSRNQSLSHQLKGRRSPGTPEKQSPDTDGRLSTEMNRGRIWAWTRLGVDNEDRNVRTWT